MAKEEFKKEANNSLKEAKHFSKQIVKLLKGLKKLERGTAEYLNELVRAGDLHKAWSAAIDKHIVDVKNYKPAPIKAKKKATAKKKKK